MKNESFKKFGSLGLGIISTVSVLFPDNPPNLPQDPPTQEIVVERYMRIPMTFSSVSGSADTSFTRITDSSGFSS